MFPDITGPRPLLLPATATKTVGTPSPEKGGGQTKTKISKSSIHPTENTRFRPHAFVFSFDAKRLIRAFVRRGDPQDAGNPKGAAGLSDFLTVSHV